MSGTFNGYHVWLGIPPNEQPPNHYRLLGIATFETDLDVIDHASDRQMAHVRTFQSGPHGSLSQQILNELALARLCLLNPQKKSQYDEELRSRLTGAPAAVPVGKPLPVAQPVISVIPRATPVSPAKLSSSSSAAPARPPSVRVASAPALAADRASAAVPKAVVATSTEMLPDIESTDDIATATVSKVTIRPKKHPLRGNTSWQRPAILGFLAAVVATGFILMVFMASYLTSHNMTWGDLGQKMLEYFGVADSSAPAPVDSSPGAVLSSPPSPAAAPNPSEP